MPVIPAQPWSDLVDGMQTGDLVLFSGFSSESEWIKLFTGGEFSHSTMTYRPDPTQPPLMWQEAPEAIAPDPHTGTSHTGAQLGDAEQATIEINTAFKDVPYYVKLNWDRPSTLNATMLEILTQYEETPFGSVLQMALNYAFGHLYGQATAQDFIYCAELVALTFQTIGVLDESHPANWYSPNSFAPSSLDPIPWLGSASVDVPVEILLPSSGVTTLSAHATTWPAGSLAPDQLTMPPALISQLTK